MRSEAQKAADKRYKQKIKGTVVHWATELKTPVADAVDELLQARPIHPLGC